MIDDDTEWMAQKIAANPKLYALQLKLIETTLAMIQAAPTQEREAKYRVLLTDLKKAAERARRLMSARKEPDA